MELLQPFLGIEPHPAADGDIVTHDFEIVQLGVVAGAGPQVELHDSDAPWWLPPYDVVEHHVGAGQVRPDVDQMLFIRALRNRDLDWHFPGHEMARVEVELVAIGPVQSSREAQWGLLLRGGTENVLPCQLHRYAGDQQVP